MPTWSGDPAEFEHFATACRWYEKSLKESERRQAAPRIWSRLQGAAKAVVRHLNPDEYETDRGLQKLLQVLRDSPLQQLPVPDSFSRLEKWNSLRRRDGESIAELLVREEDLFTQLQQALQRARGDRIGNSPVSVSFGPDPRDVPSTPSQTGAGGDSPIRGGPRQSAVPQTVPEEPTRAAVSHTDFFGDEMRGYRLLKAASLSRQEKQNILTQTHNSTQFVTIRRALRTMFAEDAEPQRQMRRGRGIWWQDADEENFQGDWENEEWLQWQEAQEAYWAEWSPTASGWQDDSWHDALWASDEWSQSWPSDSWEDAIQEYEIEPNDAADGPEEAQFREAYALAAGEANKTLAQARDAVKKVRMARGYYAPESNSGKGLQSSPSSSPARSGKGFGGGSFGAGKGKSGKSGFGPCFICNRPGRSYVHCPDRFGGGKSPGKFGKFGKGKGKPSYFVSLGTLSVFWTADAKSDGCFTRVVIDTGASENAVGAASLQKLLSNGKFMYSVCMEDRPTFRFGNGQRSRAASRVDIQGTSLGTVSFYVLVGEEAEQTPPLLGASTLRSKKAGISYENDMFVYTHWEEGRPEPEVFAVRLQVLPSRHITIDLQEEATRVFPGDQKVWALEKNLPESVVLHSVVEDEPFLPLYVFENVNVNVNEKGELPTADRLQFLAQRLQALSQTQFSDESPGACSMRRSSSQGVPMLREALWQSQNQQVCRVGNMSSMWPTLGVHQQEGLQWRDSTHGSRSSTTPPGLAGHGAESDSPRASDGENGHREGHGGSWQMAATGSDDQSCPQYDLGGVPQANGHLSGSAEGESIDCVARTTGQVESPTREAVDHGGGCEECSCIRGEDQGGKPPVAERSSEDGHYARSEKLGGEGHLGHGDQGGGNGEEAGAGGDELGCNQCGIVNGEGRRSSLSTLWDALKSLKQKMSGGGDKSQVDSLAPDLKQFEVESEFEGDRTLLSSPEAPYKGKHGASVPQFSMKVVKEKDGDVAKVQSDSGKNVVWPSVAKKLAVNAAVLGAFLIGPCHGLLGQLQSSPDFMEVACAPNSSLSSQMEENGYMIKRVNYKSGFDLASRQGTSMLKQDVKLHPPKFMWVSLPCTRLSPLVNSQFDTAI